MISIISETENGEADKAGVTGSEGAAGLLEALGSGHAAVQANGIAWRVGASVCRSAPDERTCFRWAATRADEFQTVEARQSLLCRSAHFVEQRLTRWLLDMAERGNARSRTLPMTQEILGVMLAVQRTTVTAAAVRFRKAGLISYLRGKNVLMDAEGLEKTACACRSTVRLAELDILGRNRLPPSAFP